MPTSKPNAFREQLRRKRQARVLALHRQGKTVSQMKTILNLSDCFIWGVIDMNDLHAQQREINARNSQQARNTRQRRQEVKRMHKQGHTIQEIAEQLGFTRLTISNDLRHLYLTASG